MKSLNKEDPQGQQWEAIVSEAHKRPMGMVLQDIQSIADQLNGKSLQTNYEFHVQQIVDDVVPPNVAPHYFNGESFQQPIKAERTGPVVQAVLDQLPTAVRTGQDQKYEVYQVRLDDYNSLEHVMGTTTLLIVFLNVRPEGGKCYLWPTDKDSGTNWTALQSMYNEHFPSLPSRT